MMEITYSIEKLIRSQTRKATNISFQTKKKDIQIHKSKGLNIKKKEVKAKLTDIWKPSEAQKTKKSNTESKETNLSELSTNKSKIQEPVF